MATDKRTSKSPKKGLDTFSQKRGRGRPRTVHFKKISLLAEHNRRILDQVWGSLWPLLSMSKSEEEVTKAFEQGARPCASHFVPDAALTLEVLREKTFPTRQKSRINFLADSLAGRGVVSPR